MLHSVYVLLILFLMGVVKPVSAVDPTTQASGINSSIKTYAGSKQSLNANLLKPLTSPAQMTAFDGNTFDVEMGCEGEKKALEMTIMPGASGDINPLIIAQDTTDDGTLNEIMTLPFEVSGICANGVMSCASGNWTGCSSYQWGTNAIGALELNAVGIKELGGCYCINNHCGNNLLLTNMNNIAGDLMSGAMAAITKANQKYTPTRMKVEGNLATYYKQKIVDCSSPSVVEAQLYSSPDAIAPAAFSERGTNDTYDLITNSAAADEIQTDIQTCSINRHISLTLDYIDVPSCEPGTWFSVATTAANFDTAGDNAWLESQAYCDPTGPLKIRVRAWDGGGRGACNDAMGADGEGFVTLTMPENDSISNGYVMTRPNLRRRSCYWVPVFYSGSCVSADGGCNYSFTFYNGNHNFIDLDYPLYAEYYPQSCAELSADSTFISNTNCVDLPPGGSVLHFTKMTISHSFIRPHVTPTPNIDSCRRDTEVIDDNCSARASDSECSLIQERWDGITTIDNYQPTGVQPLPGTVAISDGLCTLDITRDYWVKNREYRCKNGLTYDYNNILNRAGTVIDSVDTSTGNYADKQLNDGTWQASAGSIAEISSVTTPSECVTACKTKRARKNTDSGTYGVTSDLRVSDITYDYSYKECVDNVCPLAAGEEEVKSCDCLNEFGEATATMQAMRLGSRDLICTSGNPQLP